MSERFTQELPSEYPQFPAIHTHLNPERRFLSTCDGTLVSSSECFEPPEAIAAYRKWMAEKNRKAYIMGPLVADHAVSADKETKQSAKAPEILGFMDRILKSHGPNSMLYVRSFCLMCWGDADPLNLGILWLYLLVHRARQDLGVRRCVAEQEDSFRKSEPSRVSSIIVSHRVCR